MPADIVNLNRFRKARAKQAARETAEQNRLKHGESKTKRKKRDALQALSEHRLDQAAVDKSAKETSVATSQAPTAFCNEGTPEKSTAKDIDPGSRS